MKRGLFITVEGGEGVGKSSNIRFIQGLIETQGLECIVTREPGGTPMAEDIRQILLLKRDEPVCIEAELLLMFAARAQHLQQLILPALARGVCVLSDRFTDATYAYQCGGRGVSADKVSLLENLVQGEFRPDLTLLLDAPVEIGMSRAQHRGELDRFESEKIEFFTRVRNNYLSRAAADSARFKLVDASLPLDLVQHQIKAILALIIPYQKK